MTPATEESARGTSSDAPVSTGVLLGLALWVAWCWTLSSPALFPPMGIETDAFVRAVDPVFGGTWVLFWLVVGAFAPRIKPLSASRPVLLAMPLLEFAGTLLLVLSNQGDSIHQAGWVLGMVLGALGSAGVALIWGELYSQVSRERAASSAAASFAIAAFIGYLIMNLRPTVAVAMTLLIPLASGAILWFSPRVWSGVAPVREIPGRPSILYKWLLWAGAIAAAFGLSNALTETDVSAVFFTYYLLTAGGVALAVVLLDRFLPRKLDYGAVYRIIGPLMVAGLLLLAFPHARYLLFAQTSIDGAWVLVRMLTWIVLADLTPRLRMPAARTFGWTLAAMSIGRQIGWQASNAAGEHSSDMTFIIVAAAVLLTVLTASVLVNERDVVAIFSRSTPAPSDDPDDVWERTSSAIAEKFTLSPKQQEVVLLLLQGYDNLYMQKSLYIAGSTLKAHLRDIYAKTGVHSRQELVALCASYLPKP